MALMGFFVAVALSYVVFLYKSLIICMLQNARYNNFANPILYTLDFQLIVQKDDVT